MVVKNNNKLSITRTTTYCRTGRNARCSNRKCCWFRCSAQICANRWPKHAPTESPPTTTKIHLNTKFCRRPEVDRDLISGVNAARAQAHPPSGHILRLIAPTVLQAPYIFRQADRRTDTLCVTLVETLAFRLMTNNGRVLWRIGNRVGISISLSAYRVGVILLQTQNGCGLQHKNKTKDFNHYEIVVCPNR